MPHHMLSIGVDLPKALAQPLPAPVTLIATGEQRASADRELRREFSLLYDAVAPSLLRYARSIAPDPDIARDAVQETFFRYFLYRREGNPIDNDRAWLFRVARNVVFDQVKSVGTSNTVPLENDCASVDPRAEFDRDLNAAAIRQMLPSVLSGRELECIRLRTEGLRYEEIGAVMNLQSGTVGAMIARSLTKLRRVFGGSL